MDITQRQVDEYVRIGEDLQHLPADQRHQRLLATPITLPDGRQTTFGQLTTKDLQAIRDYIYAYEAQQNAEPLAHLGIPTRNTPAEED